MGTWTNMKIEKQVKIEWANALKTHVLCTTLYGALTESVEDLERKANDKTILPAIRKIFQDMLDFTKLPPAE